MQQAGVLGRGFRWRVALDLVRVEGREAKAHALATGFSLWVSISSPALALQGLLLPGSGQTCALWRTRRC